MKLNLNFDLYKGTTRLKQWYKEVKAHFTEVQEAHNALEDTVAAESGKLSTEITQRTNADIALSDRINAEENTRSSADASLGQRITTEENARTESDNEIKASIAQMRADYFGDGSMLTFEWTGEVPDARFVSEGSSEPCVDVDLSGMFELDGMPCGIMTATEILLNYVEDNNGEVTSFNNGVTYIIASFNTKTQEIEVTWSDEYEETSVTDNICRFTAARYYIETQANSSGGYSFISNSGTSYKVSATVSKAALMDKVEQNSQAISVLRDNINSEATTRETADAALEDKINYIISLRPSDREIFVMCDGDHDELKIQAALDAVATGGVVYPVTSNGDVAVLTNANTNKGYSPITTYDVVLKVGQYKTLDFRFCDGVMFDNTNPGDNQAVFNLSQYAQIRNLWYFYESSDTCTTESINPTVLYTANYCSIDNCNFDSIQGMNTTTASQFLFRVGQYCKFKNNTLNGISLNNITGSQRGFDFGTGTVVENNRFQNITSLWTDAKVFYFTSCNVEKNVFIAFDLGGNTFYTSSGFVNNNRFSATNNTYFRFGGIVKGNTFHTITTTNEHNTTFLADSNSNVVDNLFYAITANDSYALVTVNNNATFSNKMYNITPPGSADIPIVYLSDEGAVFKENEVKLKSGTDTALVTLTDDWTAAVIKDNITNAASIGTYSSTCVVEGNITGFGA